MISDLHKYTSSSSLHQDFRIDELTKFSLLIVGCWIIYKLSDFDINNTCTLKSFNLNSFSQSEVGELNFINTL